MVGSDDSDKNPMDETRAAEGSPTAEASPTDEAPPAAEASPTDEAPPAAEASPTDEVPPGESDGRIIRSPSQEQAAVSEEGAPQDAAPVQTDWEEQYDKTRNQLLRVAADFENYKKRTKRDLQDVGFRARDEVLQELLPVIDNLERAIEHADETGECVDADTLLEGVRMVLRQFEGSMERFGVKGFDSVGAPFDPNFHEALQKRETDEVPAGHVVEEYRKGYLMGDRLVRPAMVVVAAAPAENGKDPTEDAATEAEESTAVEGETPEEQPSGE